MEAPKARKRTMSPDQLSSKKNLPEEPLGIPVKECLMDIIKNFPSVWYYQKNEFAHEEWKKIAAIIEGETGIQMEAITLNLLWNELKADHYEAMNRQQKNYHFERMSSLLAYINKYEAAQGGDNKSEKSPDASMNLGADMTEIDKTPFPSLRIEPSVVTYCHPGVTNFSQIGTSPSGHSMASSSVLDSDSPKLTIDTGFRSGSVTPVANGFAGDFGSNSALQGTVSPYQCNLTHSVYMYTEPLITPGIFSLSDHLAISSKLLASDTRQLIDRTLSVMAEQYPSLKNPDTKPSDEEVLRTHRIFQCIGDLEICQRTFVAARSPPTNPTNSSMKSLSVDVSFPMKTKLLDEECEATSSNSNPDLGQEQSSL